MIYSLSLTFSFHFWALIMNGNSAVGVMERGQCEAVKCTECGMKSGVRVNVDPNLPISHVLLPILGLIFFGCLMHCDNTLGFSEKLPVIYP